MRGLDIWRQPTGSRSPLPSIWDDYRRNFNRMFQDMESMFGPGMSLEGTDSAPLNPACDIEEMDNNYLMSFDMPGVRKEDIGVQVEGNRLQVSAQRSLDREQKKGSYFQRECYQGEYRRSFTLPESIDPQKVEADYENGVLRIVLPKGEESRSTKIKLGESKSGFIKKFFQRQSEKEEQAMKQQGHSQTPQAS